MRTLFTIAILLICTLSKSQNLVWAQTFGGASNDIGRCISTDNSGNVIAAGLFIGTADLDPGAATYTVTSAGYEDVYISKLSPSGSFVWGFRFGNATGTGLGTGEKVGGITTDASGNIYVVGTFSGTVDFDPGIGFNSLTSAGATDIYVAKYNSSGAYVWAKSFGGTSSEMGNAIDVDNTGVYTTGYSSAGADFNPSATTNTITNYGSIDIFASKLDLNGNYVWAQGMGGPSLDAGYGIKVNPFNNNVYVTGYFYGSADLSPALSSPTLTSTGYNDIFVSQLNPTTGASLGQAAMGGSAGNDIGLGIDFDSGGNVYTVGSYTSSCDFDPTLGYAALNSSGGTNCFVSKLSYNLLYQWAVQIDGPGTDEAEAIVIDALNNIYVTGYFNNTCDFDPTASTYTLSAGGQDAFVWKLNSSGNLIWAKNWGGSSSEIGNSIALDANTNVFTTGYFGSTCDFDPNPGTYTITTNGGLDSYVSKLSCTLPSTVTVTPASYSLCIGTSTSIPFSLISTPEANVTYSWSTSGASGIGVSSSTGTTTTLSFTASTSYSVVVTATNVCGTTTTNVSVITVNPLPFIIANASPTAVCSGSLLTLSGSGANTYTWSNGVTNGSGFIPSASLTYTVTGKDINTCVNTTTINVPLLSNPTVSVSGKNIICLNKPNTLTASGASTYTWLPSSISGSTINAQPSTNTIYTVNGTAINGCENSKTFSVNLVTPVTPSICVVSVDSLSLFNYIIWDKTPYTNVDSFIVYREVSTNTYKRIGAQHQSAYSQFIDTARSVGPANGNPNITSYRYKLQLRDTCGNYSALSPYHNSIYFISNSTGTYFWNTYDVEGAANTPVSTFNLIRDNTANGTWTVVGSASGTQTSLTDPAFASYANGVWRVEALGFNCSPSFKLSPTAQINKSKSNVKNNFNIPLGINVINLDKIVSVSPNPAITELTISFSEEIKLSTTIIISDVLGKMASRTDLYEGKKATIQINELTNGIYFIKIQQGNNTTIKKFVKQ